MDYTMFGSRLVEIEIRVVVLFLLLTAFHANAATGIAAGAQGLVTLNHNGVEYVGKGAWCNVTKIGFGRGNPAVPAAPASSPLTSRTAYNLITLTRSYTWGTVTCTYAVAGDEVRASVNFANASSNTLSEVVVQLIDLAAPSGDVTRMPGAEQNLGGPDVLFIPYGPNKLFVANDEVAKMAVVSGFRIPGGLGVYLDTGVMRILPPLLPNGPQRRSFVARSIPPGAADHYSLSIRFAAENASPKVVEADLFQRWAVRFPQNQHWADRRPIGELILAGGGRLIPYNPLNPRYWRFVDPKLDINSQRGRDDFRTRLLAEADKSVAALKAMNGQGVIVWDIEGEQFPALQYIGDPRHLPPEMEGVVDEFFKRFTQAGMRCGVTLAVRKLMGPGSDDNSQLTSQTTRRYLDDPQELFDLLDQTVGYAKKRWGCTLFYVDADGNAAFPTDPAVFRRLESKHPDILLIPEHKVLLHYASTSPYCEEQQERTQCPSAEARWLYSRAFSVIRVTKAEVAGVASKAIDPVRRVSNGDVLMTFTWAPLTNPYFQHFTSIQQRALRSRLRPLPQE